MECDHVQLWRKDLHPKNIQSTRTKIDRFALDSWNFLVEPENRIGFFTDPYALRIMYKEFYRSGVSSIYEANENVASACKGITTNTALRDIIHLKTSQLHEFGIISYLDKNSSLEGFRAKPDEIGPQILTIRHLKAGFVVIGFFLALSCIVFMIECGPILWKKLKTLFEISLMCYIVVKFVRMKKML
jgi:hypothetical protein